MNTSVMAPALRELTVFCVGVGEAVTLAKHGVLWGGSVLRRAREAGCGFPCVIGSETDIFILW